MVLTLKRFKPRLSAEKHEAILAFFEKLLEADSQDALLFARVLQILHSDSLLSKSTGLSLEDLQNGLLFLWEEEYESDYIRDILGGLYAHTLACRRNHLYCNTELGNDVVEMLKEYAVVRPELRVFTKVKGSKKNRSSQLIERFRKRHSLKLVT